MHHVRILPPVMCIITQRSLACRGAYMYAEMRPHQSGRQSYANMRLVIQWGVVAVGSTVQWQARLLTGWCTACRNTQLPTADGAERWRPPSLFSVGGAQGEAAVFRDIFWHCKCETSKQCCCRCIFCMTAVRAVAGWVSLGARQCHVSAAALCTALGGAVGFHRPLEYSMQCCAAGLPVVARWLYIHIASCDIPSGCIRSVARFQCCYTLDQADSLHAVSGHMLSGF
jgi:hypothetical protein